MHTVLIVLHLLIAIGLVALILLQRSEGGALGMGGGPGGLMSGRSAGNVLSRSTQILAVAFFATSVALAVFSGEQPGSGSVAGEVGDLERQQPGASVPIDDDNPLGLPSASAPAQPEVLADDAGEVPIEDAEGGGAEGEASGESLEVPIDN